MRLKTCVGILALVGIALLYFGVRECGRERQILKSNYPEQATSTNEICSSHEIRLVTSCRGIPRPVVAQTEKKDVSREIRTICGLEPETASAYLMRNKALRAIAFRHDLTSYEVATLLDYVASTNDVLRIEKSAALKNDVLNLLRAQSSVSAELVPLLISIIDAQREEGGDVYPNVMVDYAVQHLGTRIEYVSQPDQAEIRKALARAASRTKMSYAGTALYALVRNSDGDGDMWRKQTIAMLADETANSLARMAAVQIVGACKWREAHEMIVKLASSAKGEMGLQLTAIGTLGLIGTQEDRVLLARLSAQGNPRLKVAIETADKRIVQNASSLPKGK